MDSVVDPDLVWALALPLAYLLGTFPSAQLIARAHGVDITRVGSGNPGASNVARALGWRRGIWVFVLDAAKGAFAAGVGLALGSVDGAAVDARLSGYLLGAAAVLGHVAPAVGWFGAARFRGGKGVATGGGVLLVMLPIAAVAAIATWWLVTRLTRTAAVGSIAAVVVAGTGLALRGAPVWEFAAAIGVCVLILSRHLGNVRRILRREEHALGQPGWEVGASAGENHR